jgi:predicted ATP-dependent endonuclease of OLD family
MWENYYKASFDAYMSSVRNADIPTELPMVYIEKSMWQIILLCMLQKRQEVDAFDQFLTEKLGIGPEGVDEVCLTLNRDVWDRWETENQITLYIRQIQKRMGGGIQLTSSDVNQFNPSDDLPRALFYKLLGATAVIDRLKITYNHGIDSMLLSEGEKKMMVVLFILEALADERTLVLMDEPDSHIHISRKAELCEMFHKMDHRASIITSHSPTLTAAFEQEYRRSIIMLTKEQNGKVKMIDNDVVNMVETLTDGIWTSQQQNLFLNSTDDIILVEGKSDGLFIGTALKHFQQKGLYPGLHFTFVPCGGASGVKLFMDKFRPKNGQMIMAFFDGDDAGKNGMTEIIKGKRKKDKNKGEIGSSKKSVKVGHTWVSLYPPYKNRRDTVAFNVEDYLSYKLFRKIIFRFTSLATIKSKETVKSDMSSACEKDEIKVEYYKNFATLFNNILAIKQADADGNKEVDWVW